MDCIRIGALLASLRREKGMTQRAVASLLGVSDKAVSKWECGMAAPIFRCCPTSLGFLG